MDENKVQLLQAAYKALGGNPSRQTIHDIDLLVRQNPDDVEIPHMEKKFDFEDMAEINRLKTNQDVLDDFCQLITKLSGEILRKEKILLYTEWRLTVKRSTSKMLKTLALREIQHAVYISDFYRAHSELAKDITGNVPGHDHSKDDLFYAVLGMSIYIFPKDKKILHADLQKSLKELCTSELNRHYIMESHHPQHEDLTGNKCNRKDVREMAIDRLSRSIQFSGGWNVDTADVLNSYMIKLTRGEEEEIVDKHEYFVINVLKYRYAVQGTFRMCTGRDHK